MTSGQTSGGAEPGRPLGVAILALLMGIYGFIVFIVGLLLVLGVTAVRISGETPSFGALGISTVFGAILVAIIGLIILGVAVGLWRLHQWALVVAIIVLIVNMIFYGIHGAFISFGFIVSLILFIYLLAVSRHFF